MSTESLRTLLLIAAAVVGIAGALGLVVLWWFSRRTGFRPALREGATVVASDTGAAPPVLLIDAALGLCGRPDYILEQAVGNERRLVPVEYKPTRRSRRLFESDELQLGAYLLVLRATWGELAAPFGYVRYPAGWFRVELTDELERRVRDIVAAIRAGRRATVVHRSHRVPARCAACAMRRQCDEALV